MGAPYGLYWGKAERDSFQNIHALPCHGLDTAALARFFLQQDRLLAQRFSLLTGLSSPALEALVPFLAGLHDLGKFSPRFQALRPDIFQAWQGRQCLRGYLPHTSMGASALVDIIIPAWQREGWFGLGTTGGDDWDRDDFLKAWLAPVAGHHGLPVEPSDKLLATLFEAVDQEALLAYARDLASLLGADEPLLRGWNLTGALDGLRASAWLLAGFIVLCDWLASTERLFPHQASPDDLETYWPRALALAGRALEQAGLLPAELRPFNGLTGLFPHLTSPRPLQAHLASVELPAGPSLFILEDATGSGKTEAALALAQRLMGQGRAQGFFLGMPTMATANAMFGRMREAYKNFFGEGARPSLVLAHSQRRLAQGFGGLLDQPDHQQGKNQGEEDEDSQGQAAAWLADSNKKALLATVGVGTLDQALLAALPVKHQCLRLLGLGRSLLIADEVHAYDAYTTEVLANTLHLLAGLGGSAILLSATLPLTMRQRLVQAFARGLNQEQGPSPASQAYPLVTTVHQDGLEEQALPLAPGLDRHLRVSLLDNEDSLAERLRVAVGEGACACWIRNTVDDALRAYGELCQALGPDRVELFHARLAMCDRLERETAVLRRFGPQSQPKDRVGRLLVATQVVEQSLDLDFDILASDLAPVDLIIQRAGRLHRHQRPGRPLAVPELLVLSPEPTLRPAADWYRAFLPKAAFVYPRPGQLWLTARLLQQRPELHLPQEARALVEGVYGQEAQADIPPALADLEEREEGRQSAERSLARLHGLPYGQGYVLGDTPWNEDTPTRLGPETVTLRLARWHDGLLSPWAPGEDIWAWELSQVRVRRGLVAGQGPAPGPELARALETAKNSMADHCARALLLALEAGPDGIWRGRAVNKRQEEVEIRYHPASGLEVS